MKILLTGASGFIGSHILDSLRSQGLNATLLLREGSSKRFIAQHLHSVEVRTGDFSSPDSLMAALSGITHVIHCAGCIRAFRVADFYTGNQLATRNLVTAASKAGVQRFVHVSSLAAVGLPVHDRRNGSGEPAPVSEYGKSKLAAEAEVRTGFPGRYVILRPPSVYGPRDPEFLRLFKAVKGHLVPASSQRLSVVYVKDLAEVVVECLSLPGACGHAWFVANPEIVTVRKIGERIAAELGVKTMLLPLPRALLFALCAGGQVGSWLRRKPSVLSMQKYVELRAPAWVGDPEPLHRELGLECRTGLEEGIRLTQAWYVQNGWL